jgi:hypothetical protein
LICVITDRMAVKSVFAPARPGEVAEPAADDQEGEPDVAVPADAAPVTGRSVPSSSATVTAGLRRCGSPSGSAPE